MTTKASDLLSDKWRQQRMMETMRHLFAGRAVDPSTWIDARDAYERFAPSGQSDTPPAVHAFGMLARVIAADTRDAALAALSKIPESDQHALARALAGAVVAAQGVRTPDRDPSALYSLAQSLFELGRFHTGPAEYLALHRQMITVLLEYFGSRLSEADIRDSLSAAADLTGAASQLAVKCGVSFHLDDAIAWGERVIGLNSATRGKMAIGVWVVANNIHNIYRWLAIDHPSSALHFQERRLSLVSAALHAATAAGADTPVDLWERSLRNAAAVHTSLAALKPADYELHAAEARRAIDRYAALRSDPPFQQDSAVLAQQVEQQLAAGTSPLLGISGSTDSKRFDSIFDEYTRHAHDLAEAARRCQQDFARDALIAEALDDWYAHLQRELMLAIAARGLDYDVCKALIALGAISGGKLGPVLSERIRKWASKVYSPLSDEDHVVYARQYLFIGGDAEALRHKLWGRLVGLAELVDELQSTLHVNIASWLRPRNAALLKYALTTWPCVAHYQAQIVAAEDLRHLLSSLPARNVQHFMEGYESG
jgi:hypothetical protein